MAAQLPEGPRIILNDENAFFKRDKFVVDRLKDSKDAGFLGALEKIDSIISEYDPINDYTGEYTFDEPYHGQWSIFLELLVVCSIEYTQEKVTELRDAHKDYAKKLTAISDAAYKLSMLMQSAEILREEFGLSVVADVHPLKLLQNTVENQSDAETRCRFNSATIGPAELIRQAGTFDRKYYPPVTALLDEIARQYSQDYETTAEAKVFSQKNTANDFLRHFFEGLDHAVDVNQITPRILEKRLITDADWVDIFSIALGAEITTQNIKDYRQKMKNA